MNRKLLYALSFGHFTADLNSGAVAALLPLLQLRFGLDYRSVALAILVSNVTSSVIQPIFGQMADRVYLPYLPPLALLLASTGSALYAVAPTYPIFLVLVAVAGIGVSAFHPPSAAAAYTAAGDKRASGLSIFQVGGNLGFAFGPLLVAVVVELFGQHGLVAFIGPGLIAAIVLFPLARRMRRAPRPRSARRVDRPVPYVLLGLLILVVVMRSAAQFSVMTFFPLYLTRHHLLSPSLSGGVLFFFLLMGAVGTLIGGPLSDRWGRRTLLIASWVVSVPLLWALPRLAGALQFVALGLLGFAIVATFSTTVVLAQELLPNRQAIASSLSIGFAVGFGGVIVLGLGHYADVVGITRTLDWLWLLPLAALVLSLPLPNTVEAEKRAA